jgi:hypothetical protein
VELYSGVQKPFQNLLLIVLYEFKFSKQSHCRRDTYREGKSSLITVATSREVVRREEGFKYSSSATSLIETLILLHFQPKNIEHGKR